MSEHIFMFDGRTWQVVGQHWGAKLSQVMGIRVRHLPSHEERIKTKAVGEHLDEVNINDKRPSTELTTDQLSDKHTSDATACA